MGTPFSGSFFSSPAVVSVYGGAWAAFARLAHSSLENGFDIWRSHSSGDFASSLRLRFFVGGFVALRAARAVASSSGTKRTCWMAAPLLAIALA